MTCVNTCTARRKAKDNVTLTQLAKGKGKDWIHSTNMPQHKLIPKTAFTVTSTQA
jgi:hypothetical protein